ncbi:MAG: SRPBCC family protein, partial [Caulobacterales bacterium]
YSLFPNIVLFRSLGYPYAYRFIPVQGNHEATYYDFMMFAPKPANGEPIPETRYINLGPDDSYSDCGAFAPWHGQIYDQDADAFALSQAGLRDGGDADLMFSNYQEVRIRHFHQTLSRYIDEAPAKK